MVDNVALPSWWEVNDKLDEGEKLDPLEQFIFDNEPAGEENEREFRKQLSTLVCFLKSGG